MSSSSVCQGLQSCLEPRLMEPRVLRLKLAPSKSNFSRLIAPSSSFPSLENLKNESHTEENTTTINKNNCNDDCDVKSHKIDDIRGGSFLQFINNNSENNTEASTENEKAYVHPLVKRSSSALSGKSLEMCTESLGSETGSLASESSDDISLISPETEFSTPAADTSKLPKSMMPKSTNRSVSFPPPLTSISGSSSVQVRCHREGGRLVLQAVTVTSSQTYFLAERRDGRLRLCLVKKRPANTDDKEEQGDDDDDDHEEEFGEEEFDEEENVEAKDEEVYGEEEDEVSLSEDMEGKSDKVSGQNGVEKRPSPSRCKDSGCGNDGLLNWEPFWVAT